MSTTILNVCYGRLGQQKSPNSDWKLDFGTFWIRENIIQSNYLD